MYPVMVVGSINVDTVVRCEHLPRHGETIVGQSIERFLGGKGANQAVAASRFSNDVTFVGVVGDDDAGVFLRRELESLGVRSDLLMANEAASGGAFITVDHRGENTIVIVNGANFMWPIDAGSLLTRPSFCVGQFEIPTDVTRAFFAQNRKLGGKNLLNPAPFISIPDKLFSLIDRLVLNESEYLLLRGIAARDLSLNEVVDDFFRWTAPAPTVLTLGDQGAVFKSANDTLRVRAHDVNAIDATGAGDCFVGVYAALLATGGSDIDAIQTATAAAALSVTRAGAARSMPMSTEVTEFVIRADETRAFEKL